MKSILGILCCTLVLLLSSCKDDFKVGADYKDITVVYGLLSKSDTANYIRITKGFYDEKADNLILAQNSDSIYYNNLSVKLEQYSNGALVKTIVLQRVDANLEGFVKDSGIFAQSPNYAYKFKDALDPSASYKLVLLNQNNGKVVTAQTEIINDNPSVFQINYPKGLFDRINVAEISGTCNYNWVAPPNSAFFDVVLRFWYQEKNNTTLITTYKFKDLPLAKNIPANGGNTQIQVSNEEFYRLLNSEIGIAPSNISRYVDTPDVVILAGGSVLKTYIDVTTAQGGLTYDQIRPIYTNIYSDGVLGKDALGIFSTRAIRIEKFVPYTKPSVDSIIGGSYTRNLNFVGVSTQ
ncbi:MAG: hypothetical protein JNM44_10640 [Chitinophagaceae bacterium]|nr:hypothetical protein [Chitinophagaceae bacterium]